MNKVNKTVKLRIKELTASINAPADFFVFFGPEKKLPKNDPFMSLVGECPFV